MKAESRNLLILYCLKSMEFCNHASKTMTPVPGHSESMHDTYRGLSQIFSSLGEDFVTIIKFAGLDFDFKTKEGQEIVQRICNSSLPQGIKQINKLFTKK